MAFQWCREWEEGRRTSEKASTDGKIVRTHTRVFKAKAGSKNDTAMMLLAHANAPKLFTPHPNDFAATVRSRDPFQPGPGWEEWRLNVEYSTETPDPTDNEGENPLAQPPKRAFRTELLSRIRIKDRDNNFILNKAGVPYNPPYEEDRVLGVHLFTRNEAFITQAKIDAYINRVNSASIGSRGPGTVRLMRFDADEEYSNGIAYVVVNYEFVHDPLGWQPVLPELSFMEKVGGELRRIKDDKGEDTAEPWPIDTDGVKIATASLPGAAISTTWSTFETANFNDFGLRFI